jgi:hypothetical membrane protein
MKRNGEIMVLTAAYILMLLTMFILPFFSVAEYSIIRDTLSELGSQAAPNAWIMNLIFVSLAIGSVIAGWGYFSCHTFQRIILLLFGISVTLMAVFNHAPVDTETLYDIMEDGWHSYFACTALFSFTILSITTGFILEKPLDRQVAMAAGISAIFLAVMMFEADQLAGVWQRLIFIISFGWMICNFKTREF